MGMGHITGRRGAAALLVAAAVSLVGCSNSTHTAASGGTRTTAGPAVPTVTTSTTAAAAAAAASASSAASIAGRWTGTFTSTAYRATSGEFVVVFTQSGSHIGGSITITPSCVPAGTVSGSLSGGVATFGQVSGGGTAVSFSGTVGATSMHGTYRSGAQCGNDAGTWQAHRS